MIVCIHVQFISCILCIVLQEEATTVSASVKKITNDNAQVEKEVDILAESLTQQPNLSQG